MLRPAAHRQRQRQLAREISPLLKLHLGGGSDVAEQIPRSCVRSLNRLEHGFFVRKIRIKGPRSYASAAARRSTPTPLNPHAFNGRALARTNALRTRALCWAGYLSAPP